MRAGVGLPELRAGCALTWADALVPSCVLRFFPNILRSSARKQSSMWQPYDMRIVEEIVYRSGEDLRTRAHGMVLTMH